MPALNDSERECLRRYCELLHERLGPRLVAVRMFGSAARGDMWAATSPMHSDIDLLVVTRRDVPQAEQEELLNETYSLYLECGRQLSPHFFSEQRISEPENERTRAFLERVEADAVAVCPDGLPQCQARWKKNISRQRATSSPISAACSSAIRKWIPE
jgi:predicted nucleotidyltransferase